jgi:hypothetical protein
VGSDAALGQLGFESEGDHWVREVAVAPVPVEETSFATLGTLESAIRSAWSAETSCDPSGWTAENPSYQHCDVTAWVVSDYLGGEIVVSGVVRDGARVDRHVWNRLSSGLHVDLTREQFRDGELFEAPVVVTEAVGESFASRYELFSTRVRAKLSA